MKIKLLAFVIGTIAVLTVTFFNGCRPNDDRVVRIGVILPLTGTLATMGEVEKNAMSLAAQKANLDGKKLELFFEDGKGNPATAVSAARKLLDLDKVDILITSTTGASLAVEPVATESKKNLIAFCMDPDIAKKSEYVIRYYEGIDEEAAAINQYFTDNTRPANVGILYAKVPVWEKVVNNTLIPHLKSKNLSVPYVDTYAVNEGDFKTTVLKMKESGIDHLILLGYGFEYPNIFKSLVENGLIGKIQLVGGWGFLYTTVDPNLLEGALVSGPEYVFKKREVAGSFYDDYYNSYKQYPNFDAAFAYNAIESLANNISKSDLNGPIKQVFAKKGQMKGVVGPYSFSPAGEMIVTTSLGQYRNGNIFSVAGETK
jgi:branched-chain amino acid transport system substrate-binding protein